MPRVSIIIPAYNSLQYLPATLESVLEQSFDDYEVIVVNDGSSDNIEEWFATNVTDPRLRLVSQLNQGPSVARNTGIKESTSEYLAFLDSDDLWERSKLQKQIQVLDSDPDTAIIYTWLANIDVNGKPTGKIRSYENEGLVWPELIKHNFIGCGSNAVVRRTCFDQLGLFDPSTTGIEDWDMWLRIADRYPFRVIREPLVYYRQHPASLSNNWTVLETSFQRVLEKAFSSVDPARAELKTMSYALAYLCLSWKPVQSRHRDYAQSARLLRKAVSYDPKLRFTSGYLRLTLTILAVRYFGAKNFDSFLAGATSIRKHLGGLKERRDAF